MKFLNAFIGLLSLLNYSITSNSEEIDYCYPAKDFRVVENRLIVSFKQNVSDYNFVKNIIKSFDKNAKIIDLAYNVDDNEHFVSSEKEKIFSVDFSPSSNYIKIMNSLKNKSFIKDVEFDYYIENCSTTNDSHLSDQWGLAKIDVFDAWDTTTGGSSVKIGIMENGTIAAAHEDLYLNYNHILSHNFNTNETIFGSEGTDHTTHVSGIIGAIGNNYSGISGVCQTASLISLFTKTISECISATYYASNNLIRIINMSFSSPYSASFYSAILSYTGLIVCAAGNDGADTDLNPVYPACYLSSNIISVGNTNQNDGRAISSNYGYYSVDLFAPGTSIYSTICEDDYDYLSGTSMAAPFVSGVAGLLTSYNYGLTPSQIKESILNSVDVVSSLAVECVSGGRLNAYNALQYAMNL